MILNMHRESGDVLHESVHRPRESQFRRRKGNSSSNGVAVEIE